MPRKLRLLGVALIASLTTGCAIGGSGISDTSCKSFRTISASTKDTAPTKRQVIEHNKAYTAICGEQKA